jgi:hypothetical protein
MALSKVGTGASDDAAGVSQTSRTLTKDSGLANGDLIIIGVPYYEDTSNAVLNAVTGGTFTDHGATPFESIGTATEARLHIFSRVVDGTEDASFGVSRSAQFAGQAMMVSLRGSAPLSVVSVTVGSPVSGATSVTAPSVVVGSSQGIVAVFALGDPGGTYTPPATMTLGISEATEQSTVGRMFYESPSAGASGVRTLSWTNSRTALGVMMLIEGANAGGGGSAIPVLAGVSLRSLLNN